MLTSTLARMKAALAVLAADLRVDVDEAADVLQGALEGVDLTAVGSRDPAERVPAVAEPVTPLERLHATPGVVVSRDFRAAGKGATWDRVRDYDPRVHGWPRNKQRGQARGVLPWAKVSTIVLHTTGVGGIHPDRGLGIPAHMLVADDATVALLHELNSYLWSAHAANRFSCSLEIAGDRAITDEQIPAARAALRYMAEELRRKRPAGPDGEPLPVYVAPHRFYHRSRVKDCDVMIWEAVGAWGMRELGLLLGPVVGSGKPLPW